MKDMQDDLEQGYANGSGSSFFMGLLCGVAVGAAVGLIFAPKPGAELRQQIGTSAARLRRKASETYDDASQAVSNVVAKGKRAFETGREAFESSRPGEGVAGTPGASL